MRVLLTGATGLVGARLVARLQARGDQVTVLSRSPERAAERLGVRARGWDAMAAPAPVDVLDSADAVIHLAGEPVAQRWRPEVKQRIRASRVLGTANLVKGLEAASERPATLLSASAAGYYGDRGEEILPESSAPGQDFLAQVCVGWEQAAEQASQLGVRVVRIRTGVVLDSSGGALEKMLPPFKLGIGGPVAGGRQYMPWVHLDDLLGLYLAALDGSGWVGPVNGCAPEPITNHDFSRALGRALKRPAVMPVPALALRLLYGEMASMVTGGQRMVPARALELGYEFRHADLAPALRAAL